MTSIGLLAGLSALVSAFTDVDGYLERKAEASKKGQDVTVTQAPTRPSQPPSPAQAPLNGRAVLMLGEVYSLCTEIDTIIYRSRDPKSFRLEVNTGAAHPEIGHTISFRNKGGSQLIRVTTRKEVENGVEVQIQCPQK